MQQYINEIKKRLVRIAVIFLIVFGALWNYTDDIVQYLIGMTDLTVITVSVFEMIQSEMYVCLFVSVLVVLPYTAFEVYRFIAPGLYPKERKVIKWCLLPFYFMFIFGATVPTAFFMSVVLSTLSQYYITGVEQTMALSNYVSFVLSTSVILGVLFCLPNFSGVLAYMGVLDSSTLPKYRKHFIVVSLIFCAVVTPSPDALSLIALETPVILIYEGSIYIVRVVNLFYKKTTEGLLC